MLLDERKEIIIEERGEAERILSKLRGADDGGRAYAVAISALESAIELGRGSDSGAVVAEIGEYADREADAMDDEEAIAFLLSSERAALDLPGYAHDGDIGKDDEAGWLAALALRSEAAALIGEASAPEEGGRLYIRTRNSTVDSADLAEALKDGGIDARPEDDGVSVDAGDYERAEDILHSMEQGR